MSDRKPTKTQRAILDNLIRDGSIGSIFPWPSTSILACLAYGWIVCSHAPDGYTVTDAGRLAVKR